MTDSIARSLYIHWPFCPYRCHFCPFVTVVGQHNLMDDYCAALIKELKMFKAETENKIALETIYIGGGTPSTWPDKLLLDTSGILKDMFDISGVTEWSLEANPGTVRKEQLALWKACGINRLSIGVQSLNDAVLAELNRHQKATDVYKLIDWCEGVIENISIDLIIGLPGISDDEWKATIAEVGKWPIKHISMYFLSIHENTPLYTRLIKNELTLPLDDPVVDLYYWSIDALKGYGFDQYEVSSFAKPGYRSHHNQVYWDRKPYKAIGIGACSFDGGMRYANDKNIMRYMNGVQEGRSVVVDKEVLTNEQVILEIVMLGLRRMDGLIVKDVTTMMIEEKAQKFLDKMAIFEQEQLVVYDGTRLYLTKKALPIENEIAVKLLG